MFTRALVAVCLAARNIASFWYYVHRDAIVLQPPPRDIGLSMSVHDDKKKKKLIIFIKTIEVTTWIVLTHLYVVRRPPIVNHNQI